MKKLLFLILLPMIVFAQQGTWLEKNPFLRDSSGVLVPVPAGKRIAASYFIGDGSLLTGVVVRLDSTTMPGYVTRTVFATDSLYRAAQEAAIKGVQAADSAYKAAQIALRVLSTTFATDSLYRAAQEMAIKEVQAADSTYKTAQIALRVLLTTFATDSTYRAAQETAIRAVQAADSTYKAAELLKRILYSDTTSNLTMRWVFVRDSLYRAAEEAAIKETQAADSTYKAAQIALKLTSAVKSRGTSSDSLANKSDFARITISVTMDSAWINTVDTLIVALPDYAIVLDSIGVWQKHGVEASVVYKFLYWATNPQAAGTAIITSPATVTSAIAKTWQSTLANATLPANGLLGVLCSTVTTKPKSAAIHFLGKRQANGVNY